MKKITVPLFVTTSLLVLSGCKKSDNVEVLLWRPDIFIEYVYKDGNQIVRATDPEPVFIKKYPVENLSITNEKGKIFQYRNVEYPCILIDLWDTFTLKTPKSEHRYIIKYSIPNLLGESVEEIRLTYMVDKMFTEFIYACYNGNEDFRFVTEDMIEPDGHDPSYKPDEEKIYQRVKELLYNGDRVAFKEGGYGILLIIPIDIEK